MLERIALGDTNISHQDLLAFLHDDALFVCTETEDDSLLSFLDFLWRGALPNFHHSSPETPFICSLNTYFLFLHFPNPSPPPPSMICPLQRTQRTLKHQHRQSTITGPRHRSELWELRWPRKPAHIQGASAWVSWPVCRWPVSLSPVLSKQKCRPQVTNSFPSSRIGRG